VLCTLQTSDHASHPGAQMPLLAACAGVGVAKNDGGGGRMSRAEVVGRNGARLDYVMGAQSYRAL
jgi:hypothetical protein